MRVLKIALVISSVVVELSAQSSGKQIVRGAPGQPCSAAIRMGGFVYVSGMMATDLKGDITAQTKQVFENLRGVLKQAGSSVDNIAVATVTLQQESDFAAMEAVYREQFRGDPPARTTYVGNIVRPGALLEVAVTAIPSGGQRRAITPPGWMKPAGPYSHAIQSGDTLFLSGMMPRNMKDLSPVEGDIVTQVRSAMGNAAELLKAAGMSLDDTVTSRLLFRQRVPADFQNMNNTYASYWDVKDPRATGVVPGRPGRETLRLGPIGAHDMEVTFIAVKSSAPREVVIPPNPDGSPGQLGPLPFSPAIRIGSRIWTTGTVGSTPGDIKAQTKEAVTRLGGSLKVSGFDFRDVVAVEVWMTMANVSQYDEVNEVLRTFFPTDPPVCSAEGFLAGGGGNALMAVALTAVK